MIVLEQISDIHLVRKPLRARQHSVGLIVILKALFRWIPVQSPLRFHRDVVQQTGGTRPVSDLSGCDRRFSGLNAFEPVSVLV